MGRRERNRPGKIRGLLTLLEGEHRAAVEYDLIALGLRLEELGTERLSWRDLWVIITQAPPTSATYRSTQGELAIWGLPEHLLAKVADGIAWLVWAKSADAAKNRNRPKPIPRPGLNTPKDTTRFTGRPVPLAEMRERLGWTVIDGGGK